jgi:chorismate mutase
MKTYAVIENNKVINVIVGVEPEVIAANPDKYIETTDGWDHNSGIDGGEFFPAPPVTE